MRGGSQLELASLGATPEERLTAVRRALAERDWQDHADMAQRLIAELESNGGRCGWLPLARRVPGEFLSRNEIKRRDVEELIQDLLCRQALNR